jgi:16S rRNA processing protein RimM
MELCPIGYFSKTQGVKGQLVLKASREFKDDKVKALFVEQAGGKAPYFLSELREANNGWVITLEEIKSVEQARTLIGKQVFIDQNLVEEEESDDQWIGFELIDKHHGSLGKVKAVTDNGPQTLLAVDFNKREVILPFIEEFIEGIDEEKKQILYAAPEGLIDIYLKDEGETEDRVDL